MGDIYFTPAYRKKKEKRKFNAKQPNQGGNSRGTTFTSYTTE